MFLQLTQSFFSKTEVVTDFVPNGFAHHARYFAWRTCDSFYRFMLLGYTGLAAMGSLMEGIDTAETLFKILIVFTGGWHTRMALLETSQRPSRAVVETAWCDAGDIGGSFYATQ